MKLTLLFYILAVVTVFGTLEPSHPHTLVFFAQKLDTHDYVQLNCAVLSHIKEAPAKALSLRADIIFPEHRKGIPFVYLLI